MTTKSKIDMKHGFMQSIIRNQVDRDNYDKEVKNRQAEQNKTTKSGLQKREMQTYVPPSRRLNDAGEPSLLFQFEYEDENKHVHTMDVNSGDRAHILAKKFGRERQFSEPMTRALEEVLKTEILKAHAEFESNGIDLD